MNYNNLTLNSALSSFSIRGGVTVKGLRCFPTLLLNKERDLSFTLYLLQVLHCYCPCLLFADFSSVMNE